jgi:hypothetical protein
MSLLLVLSLLVVWALLCTMAVALCMMASPREAAVTARSRAIRPSTVRARSARTAGLASAQRAHRQATHPGV